MNCGPLPGSRSFLKFSNLPKKLLKLLSGTVLERSFFEQSLSVLGIYFFTNLAVNRSVLVFTSMM